MPPKEAAEAENIEDAIVVQRPIRQRLKVKKANSGKGVLLRLTMRNYSGASPILPQGPSVPLIEELQFM